MCRVINEAIKLTILNAASLVGRVLPGFHTRRFGVINMVVTVALACNILIWSMFGVTNVGGVAAFSALYGFFSGACTFAQISSLTKLVIF